jgi:hypothetical protein
MLYSYIYVNKNYLYELLKMGHVETENVKL